MASDRFRWHPAARIVQAAGDLTAPLASETAAIADEPAAIALAKALHLAALGRPFRIGGGGNPPRSGELPMFETLTSGTSGSPRHIWRSQASWTASFQVNAGLFAIGPGVQVAVPGRLIHSLALYGALEALHLGATLHLLADLRPDRQRSAMARGRVAVLYATPAQMRLLTAAKGPALPDLRLIFIGGATLDAALRAAITQMAPHADVREFYGAAETSFVTMAAPDDPPTSVGRAYPGVSIEIRSDSGAPLPAGQVGEVWVQSPYLFHGYSTDPGLADWCGTWLSVGEIGHLTNGALTLLGRKSRVVQVADQSVYPEELEAFIATLPGIAHVAVLARADAKRGAVLFAVAIGDPANQAAILAATRVRFGALKSPRKVIWRQDWPLLASGKTDLAALSRGLP